MMRTTALFLSLLVGQFLGCQRQQLNGIEYVENPGAIGLEKGLWSPVDSNEFLVTASVSGFLGESEVYLFNLLDDSTQEITKTARGDVLGESWSLAGDKIILTANIDTEGYEDGGIWLWDKGTGNIQNLLCCKGIDAATMINQNQIILSPVIGVNNGFADLILLDINNRKETKINSDFGKGHIYDLSFSQIRNALVFALWNEGVSTIHILELENNSVSRILVDRIKIDHPTWSPNGKMIAFTEPSLDGLLLKIINPDSGCEKVIPTTFHAIFSLTWSPDGQKIAVVGNDEIIFIDLVKIFKTQLFDPSFLCE